MTRTVNCFVGLFTIAASLALVSASRGQTGTDEKIPDEEYGIYSTLLTQKYVKPETKMLLIEDTSPSAMISAKATKALEG